MTLRQGWLYFTLALCVVSIFVGNPYFSCVALGMSIGNLGSMLFDERN